MLKHAPALYSHAEDESVGEEEWPTPAPRHSNSYPSRLPPSALSNNHNRIKLKSTNSYPSVLQESNQSAYAQFQRMYRRDTSENLEGRHDPDSHYFHRGLGQLQDEVDSEDDDPPRVAELSEHYQESDSRTTITQAERERLEWQTMLKSVLDGEVLRAEKNRIGSSMESYEHERPPLGKLWLPLRAKIRGRTPEDTQRFLERKRASAVTAVVDEIMKFRVDEASAVSAASQINNVLRRLDSAEALYPNLGGMKVDHPACKENDFQFRRDALIAWVNVTGALRLQINTLKKWTGSETLDVTQPNTTAEVPIGHLGTTSAMKRGLSAGEHADDTTFVERVLKEDSLQRTFEKRALQTLHALIGRARMLHIQYGSVFKVLNMPTLETELVQLISFPTKLMQASLRVRLDYAKKAPNMDVLMIDQTTEDFRLSLALACTLKSEYEAFMAPDREGHWVLPQCIADDYDSVILEALSFFFQLLYRKLKSGQKGIYFKETETVDQHWPIFNEVSLKTEGGATMVAEQLCSLTNKLVHRVIDYFETQLKVPSATRRSGQSSPANGIDGADNSEREMTGPERLEWFAKILDSVRLRYRKLQHFTRFLTHRFSNSAEYSLERINVDFFIKTLVDSGHWLVYNEHFQAGGLYIVADQSLREKPSMVERMIKNAFQFDHRRSPHMQEPPRALIGPEVRPQFQQENSFDSSPTHKGSSILSGQDSLDDDMAPSYIIIFSPSERFFWTGHALAFDHIPKIEMDLREKRLRLIADGGQARLTAAKAHFSELFPPLEADESDDSSVRTPVESIPCLVEQQAHLPVINRELRKIVRTTNKLAEAIVESTNIVRDSLADEPKRPELLENWYQFASQHSGVYKHMDRVSKIKFNRKLTRLAISWVAFICDDCDPTDRKTFRWAVNALEFAMHRTTNILQLPETEFKLLRQKVASCMTLLISHFDILGARSSFEAKRDREKLEELRRLEALHRDGEEIGASNEDEVDNFVFAGHVACDPERSLRLFRESTCAALDDMEQQRNEAESGQHVVGRVVDDEKLEDKSLLLLAASPSNVAIRWQQGRFIGAGAFGSVYLAVNLDSGSLMAVKEIRFQDATGLTNLYQQIRDELSVMEMLRHPNIVEYYGIEVHRDKVYIFEEYCQGGSLASLLELGRIEDEHIIQVYTMQMLDGLQYLHSKGVVHRDVKPDNILLDHMGLIKFVDFGAAKVLAKNQRATLQRSRVAATGVNPPNSLTGTPMYMSPEVIRNDRRGRHGAMDVWSLGCVVLEFATGRKPWSNLDNEWAVMFHIGVATKHPPLPEPGQLSDLGINFIKQCLTIDPMLRPTATELLEHPWMVQFREALGGYEDDDPTGDIDYPATPSTLYNSLPPAAMEKATLAQRAAILHEKEIAAINASSPISSNLVTPASELSSPEYP